MLINARHSEECRVAVADDDQLIELELERADLIQLRGNIYKAAITRVEPSLQAAFLDIGANRNGFLQINDVHSAYFQSSGQENGEEAPKPPSRHSRIAIQEVLRAGQELVVQVVKDERDAKGATLTTNISIPGRYLVLMIGNQRGGVSRKINDDAQRHRLKQALQSLKMPAGMGVIVRTAGISKSSQELQADLDALLEMYYDAIARTLEPGAPNLLYKEADLPIRYLRDYLTPDIDEILIDDLETHRRALQFVERVMPSFASRVKFYDRKLPLLSGFHLDSQVEAVNLPEVTLPSGGSMVLSVTEAVVTVDVNSGRSTSQADVEGTAFKTNLEAADAIATQLRLRDLGGLIVIDFIDMADKRHKAVVEKGLRDAVRFDKAKVEIGRISKFGLLEMSRQRLKTSIVNQSQMTCPTCHGRGRVKTPESAALDALRKIETAVFSGGVTELRVRMAPSPALLLLNDKRRVISQLEAETGSRIVIYADGRMRPEEYELEIVGHRKIDEVVGRPSTENRSSEDRGDSEERRGRGRKRRRSRDSGRRRPQENQISAVSEDGTPIGDSIGGPIDVESDDEPMSEEQPSQE